MGSGRRLIGGQDADHELAALGELSRCLLDSSSAIYMEKAGFLRLLGSTVELFTIREVVDETGFTDMPVSLLETGRPAEVSTDLLLIGTATELRLPVITEDRKMMRRLDTVDIPFFNALMMLHLLLFRGRIELSAHAAHLERLLAVCRYSDRVRAYGEEVLQAVLKYR
ncbi:MAG TPA: hypothetical protein VMW87_01515 [Spirochaetia bacterium]|nr:hypothetical protein [Spirochaetia bacterium]